MILSVKNVKLKAVPTVHLLSETELNTYTYNISVHLYV